MIMYLEADLNSLYVSVIAVLLWLIRFSSLATRISNAAVINEGKNIADPKITNKYSQLESDPLNTHPAKFMPSDIQILSINKEFFPTHIEMLSNQQKADSLPALLRWLLSVYSKGLQTA